jgi:hypothetical protein
MKSPVEDLLCPPEMSHDLACYRTQPLQHTKPSFVLIAKTTVVLLQGTMVDLSENPTKLINTVSEGSADFVMVKQVIQSKTELCRVATVWCRAKCNCCFV